MNNLGRGPAVSVLEGEWTPPEEPPHLLRRRGSPAPTRRLRNSGRGDAFRFKCAAAALARD